MPHGGVWHRLLALRQCPRELWLVYALKVLESFAYFSASLNLSLYLTRVFGYSDLEAGMLYSAWGVTSGVIGLVIGPLIDWLGVRTSLLVGGSCLTLGRVMFAAATDRPQLYVSLFFLQSVGMTLGIPVLSIAIRRMTDGQVQTTAYGVFYSAMNVAAFVAGLVTDGVRDADRAANDDADEIAALRTLFWLGAAVSAAYTVVAMVWFRPLQPPAAATTGKLAAAVTDDGSGEREPAWQSMMRELRTTWRDPVFWRLVAFSGVVFGAGTIFRHMDATLPKWMEREIGPDAQYGIVYSIDPAIIIFAVPLLQAWLAEYDAYACIIAGTALTTAAPLALAVLPASYTAAVLFMLLLAAGEATYSPRLYQYAMVLAPPGREGVYGTLATVPLFLVKIVVGTAGGELLGLYCPEHGARHCRKMWFIIAATAATTPLGLVALRRWLYNDTVRQRMRTAAAADEPEEPEDEIDSFVAV